MHLIVGLGNYGEKYTYTRHNVGFLFVDELARHLQAHFSYDGASQGEIAEVRNEHEKYILLKPHTYMNRSGESLARVMAQYKIPPSRVIIVSDDTNLDLGTARIRIGGESGGHNGLKSIISSTGPDFWRVRIGVGKTPEKVPLEAWVLGGFSDEELKQLHLLFNDILDRSFLNGVHLQEETLRSPSGISHNTD